MKRVFAIILVMIMAMSILAGCNPGTTEPTSGGDDDVIVIRAAFLESEVEDYADLAVWDIIEEKFGVRFEVEEMSTEKMSLMFTSGDFVDVLFGAQNIDSKIQLAANSGDVVELTDELLEQYAPTWKKFFDENPEFYNAAKYDGDRLYSLPYVRTLEADRGIRDVWWINKTWLDELNLKMPETLDDFINVLRAFRDNAGTGSIPQNVMPWYFSFNSMIGGQFDFLGTYGLEVYDSTYMALDDEGNVINYATDVRLKSAVQTLASMYAEGLIAPEGFTETALQYTERVNTVQETPYIGVFTAYWAANEDYVPMTLFQSVEGVEPVIRCQPLGVIRNRMVLFSECDYPEKVLEVMEWLAQEDTAMFNDFGAEGEGWDYDEASDTYTVHKVENGVTVAPTNAWPGLLNDRFSGRIEFDDDHAWAKRLEAIELYGDNIMDVDHIIPPMYMSTSATKKAEDYKLNIFSRYVAPLMKKWIQGQANVTADWDEYVSQLNALGLQDYINIYQEAYDNISE